MKIGSGYVSLAAAAGLVLFLSAGCATLGPARPVSDKGLLDFLEDGKTTMEAVFEKLGQPSGTYEKGRILTYRIGSEEGKGYFIENGGPPVYGPFKKSKHSLVLIFNEQGILERHSLVNVW